jgi:hypothetical protein
VTGLLAFWLILSVKAIGKLFLNRTEIALERSEKASSIVREDAFV